MYFSVFELYKDIIYFFTNECINIIIFIKRIQIILVSTDWVLQLRCVLGVFGQLSQFSVAPAIVRGGLCLLSLPTRSHCEPGDLDSTVDALRLVATIIYEQITQL